jgi:hypothetical protein
VLCLGDISGSNFDWFKNNSTGRRVMGNYMSGNTAMIKINGKTVRSRAFREIKTYKDVFRIAGIYIADDAEIKTITNYTYVMVRAYDRFQIVDGLQYKDTSIFIERLYGRS